MKSTNTIVANAMAAVKNGKDPYDYIEWVQRQYDFDPAMNEDMDEVFPGAPWGQGWIEWSRSVPPGIRTYTAQQVGHGTVKHDTGKFSNEKDIIAWAKTHGYKE